MTEASQATGPVPGGRRRKIEIEKLLHWTYRQELPKLDVIGWSYSPMSQLWNFGTKIQDGSGSGVFYESLLDGGNPHEDALLVHQTVCELDRLLVEWHEPPESLLSDMPPDVQAGAAAALENYQIQRTATVVRFSRLGERPDWRAEPPEKKVVTGPNGKERWFIRREIEHRLSFRRRRTEVIEENGYDPKRKRPLEGAYRKFEFDPPVALIVDRRADYCNWHASLEWLVPELGAKLLTYEATLPSAAAMPWETGDTPKPRVLPVLDLKAA